MRIGALGRAGGDHPDLIQRQPTLPHPLGAAGKLGPPVRDGGDRLGIHRGRAQLPGHQLRHRPRTRGTAQPVTIQLGDDLHNAPINAIALTRQLPQLPEQHLNTLIPTHHRHLRRSGRRHNPIIAAGYDKSGRPIHTRARPSDANRHSLIGTPFCALKTPSR